MNEKNRRVWVSLGVFALWIGASACTAADNLEVSVGPAAGEHGAMLGPIEPSPPPSSAAPGGEWVDAGDSEDVAELDSFADGDITQDSVEWVAEVPGPTPNPDRDGDGLLDEQELALGTDPGESDTDGDGYWDGDEVSAGSDPLDAESVIYLGGWPYNADKAALGETASADTPLPGDQLKSFTLVDQFGQEVDLYDFAGQGVQIVLDISGPWCTSCKNIAAYLSDGDLTHLTYSPGPFEGQTVKWWRAEFEALYELVQAGEVIWITALSWPPSWDKDDEITAEDCAEWAEEFPHPLIPVLADRFGELRDHMGSTGSPALFLFDESFTLLSAGTAGAESALKALFGVD